MSNTDTTVMLAAYKQEAQPTMFFSGMFRSPPRNFHNSKSVQYDITRSEEDISIAVQDLSVGARSNSVDVYTNKEIIPPIHKEKGPIEAHTLLDRMPGVDPFMQVDFQSSAIEQGLNLARQLQRKILRAIELQAVQVLTLGVVTLTDGTGAPIYSVDWKPKTTHFPTSTIGWDQPLSTKLNDLRVLANTIRADGLSNPNMLIFGESALELFISDDAVQKRWDVERMARDALVTPERRGSGGIYHGTVTIGHQRYDMWSYASRYKDPVTGASVPYMPDDKVIMASSEATLNATFGGIPRIGPPDPRVPGALTSRITIPEQMVDIQMNAWFSEDGETMNVQAGTRPLMVPTAIDTYGCLDINLP